jgi:hypothetical protein
MSFGHKAAINEHNIVIGLRHLGLEKELLVLKIKGEDYYAFLPSGKAGLTDIDNHVSYHRSGRRHMVVKRYDGTEWIEDKWRRLGKGPQETMRQQTATDLQPVQTLRGNELF